ncbi:MAG TPA: TRAP transporter substrate-binding protein [Candidatus Sulfotelmatobacter sp.]|nr:TRAP transporter substrate-binding protein [Candidatus Sulfotelmatobacter sp.]
MNITRRTVLSRASIAAAGALAAPLGLRWPANAAEFAYKYGTALPDGHPMVIRSKEAAAKIKEESGGRLGITLYPSSVLGQDTAMMSQAIAGALEIYGMSLDILAQKSPSAAIFGVGFAFPDYPTAWKAMDGDLGKYCRTLSEKVGLYCMDKAFDHGFRQITMKSKPINTPDDLKGVKIRLPVAPLFISLFQHLGASPTALNFGEVYSALQTGVVDGQENPLILIDTAKLYEVEKYCSVTNHLWAGLHVSFNNQAWRKLPSDLQEIAYRNLSQAALTERADWQVMDKGEVKNLTEKGLAFNTPDTKPFQEALRKSGFYPDMKKQLGDRVWGLLEKAVGPLA